MVYLPFTSQCPVACCEVSTNCLIKDLLQEMFQTDGTTKTIIVLVIKMKLYLQTNTIQNNCYYKVARIQLYLTQWLIEFRGVHTLHNLESGLPINI